MKQRHAAVAVIAAYAILAVIVIPVFPHFPSPNEFTRWLLAASIVEHRTVEVSRLVRLFGPRFEDLSEADGRLYSNKAPGLAILTIPGYLVGRALAGPPSPHSMRIVLTSMRIVGSTLPTVLLAVLFLRLGGDRAVTPIWILLFATPLFTYGLLLFSHAIVAAALFGAWVALYALPERHGLIAGVLIGLATCCEYPALIPGLLLVAGVAVIRSWKTVGGIVGGGMPFAIALGVYNWIAFGSPFTLSTFYDRLPEYRELGRSALFGVHLPSPVVLLHLLFDPGRGLLIFSPVLLLCIPAYMAAQRALAREAFWTLVATPLSIIIFYSGYPNWHGGWATGPRYIVAAIPFLVFPMIYRDGGIIEALLGGWAAAAVVITSLVFPFVPVGFVFPWSSLAVPLLSHRLVAPNLFHLLWRPLAMAVPFALVIAAGAFAFRKMHAAAAIAGAFLAIIVGGYAQQYFPQALIPLQRAYIEEVYFERAGELERAVPGIVTQQPRLVQRRNLERALPPDFWPF